MSIPSGWTQTTVGELAEAFRSGDAFLKLEYTNDGVPVLAKGDIKPYGRIEHSEKRFLEASIAETRGYTLTEPDDLLVTTRDLTQKADVLGLASPVPQDQPYLVNQGANILRLKNPALNRYFVYWTNGQIYREFMRANFVGSTQIHIRHGDVMRAPVWLPPDGERMAIVDVLGALDDKIEQNRQSSQALEALARATFKAWFVDFEPVKAKAAGQTSFPNMPTATFAALPDGLTDSPIGPVPHGWTVRALSQICRIVSGGTPKRSEPTYWDGDIPWYSVKDAPPDGMPWVHFTDECISQAGLSGSAATRVPVGSTIISARGTVGRLALVARPMAFNQSCYGLLPGDHSSYRHLYLLLCDVVGELKRRSHGSVFDTITRQTFDAVDVVLPPREVLAEFENAVAPWFDLLLTLTMESHKLRNLREYLLPRLLAGTIRVEARDV